MDSKAKEIFETTWKRRSSALWGVGALGLAAGLAVGAVAPFFPVIAGVGAAEALSVLPSSMAVFGAIGMATGFTVGGVTGSTAGSAEAIVKAVSKDSSFSGKDKEKQASVIKETGDSPLINIKSTLAFAALGAIAGGILAAAVIAMPTLATYGTFGAVGTIIPHTVASNAAAVTAYSVGVMASFGSLFGLNFPKIASKLTAEMGGLLSGKSFESGIKKEKAASKAVNIKKEAESTVDSVIHDLQGGIKEVAAKTSDMVEPIARPVTKYADIFKDKAKSKEGSYRSMIANTADDAVASIQSLR
ncbi:MAG: hypothetical protein R3D71_04775 [Rickettsiales bacterium]